MSPAGAAPPSWTGRWDPGGIQVFFGLAKFLRTRLDASQGSGDANPQVVGLLAEGLRRREATARGEVFRSTHKQCAEGCSYARPPSSSGAKTMTVCISRLR
eukprot:850411-Prorocentrum_minimum.AAC.1